MNNKAPGAEAPAEALADAPTPAQAPRRAGLTSMLVDRILAFIQAGDIKVGQRLPPERDLALMFGVSRPSIREAIRALTVLGVLQTRQGDGVYVSQLQAEDLLQPLTFLLTLRDGAIRGQSVDQLYHARQLIEGEIAALAATARNDDDCDELARLIEVQKQVLKDPQRYREADTRFHAKLAEMANNPFLARVGHSMNILGLEFRKVASETSAVLLGAVLQHRNILEAVKAGEPELARKAMADHMKFVLITTKAQGVG